jgi:hypothetical protein
LSQQPSKVTVGFDLRDKVLARGFANRDGIEHAASTLLAKSMKETVGHWIFEPVAMNNPGAAIIKVWLRLDVDDIDFYVTIGGDHRKLGALFPPGELERLGMWYPKEKDWPALVYRAFVRQVEIEHREALTKLVQKHVPLCTDMAVIPGTTAVVLPLNWEDPTCRELSLSSFTILGREPAGQIVQLSSKANGSSSDFRPNARQFTGLAVALHEWKDPTPATMPVQAQLMGRVAKLTEVKVLLAEFAIAGRWYLDKIPVSVAPSE